MKYLRVLFCNETNDTDKKSGEPMTSIRINDTAWKIILTLSIILPVVYCRDWLDSVFCLDTAQLRGNFILHSPNLSSISPFYPWLNYPSEYVLLQTDSLLNIRWEKFYGDGEYYYELMRVFATNDGGCILAGTRYDFNAGIEKEGLEYKIYFHYNTFIFDL